MLGVTQGAPGRSSATARSGSLMASAPRRRPNLCPTATSPASLHVRGAPLWVLLFFVAPAWSPLFRCGSVAIRSLSSAPHNPWLLVAFAWPIFLFGGVFAVASPPLFFAAPPLQLAPPRRRRSRRARKARKLRVVCASDRAPSSRKVAGVDSKPHASYSRLLGLLA